MRESRGGPLTGSRGTVSGLVLSIGRCVFTAASVGLIVSSPGFSIYFSFCYFIASMGLQMLWSFGLACLDSYALSRKRDLRDPVLVGLLVVGDLVTAILSLAAVCSLAGVMVYFEKDRVLQATRLCKFSMQQVLYP
ncbi:hypothetical protein LWI28_028479 [Acer negundo]|uniref:CASP-like protein n=1 Tax=Acer negundo TaxID=4023 RepID=A0AAD5IT34_ACENE|nr:hypothetical protein LWI28_028479 [Acer negundo]